MAYTPSDLEKKDPAVGNRLAAGDGDMSWVDDDEVEHRIGEVPQVVKDYMEKERAKPKQTDDSSDCGCGGNKAEDDRLKFKGSTIDTKRGKVHIHVHRK